MTTYMQLPASAAGSDDARAVSPELVLVDPVLAEAARARLSDPAPAALPRLGVRTAAEGPSIVRRPNRGDQPLRRAASRRVLVGVSAITVLVLLLFDVRVEVGQQRASAEAPAIENARTTPLEPALRSGTTPPAIAPTPSRPASRPIERRFAWAPIAGATGYQVEFFRDTVRVYARQTSRPQLTVPGRWKFDGTTQTLQPGQYKWYVWPIVGGERQARAVVQTTVSIPGT